MFLKEFVAWSLWAVFGLALALIVFAVNKMSLWDFFLLFVGLTLTGISGALLFISLLQRLRPRLLKKEEKTKQDQLKDKLLAVHFRKLSDLATNGENWTSDDLSQWVFQVRHGIDCLIPNPDIMQQFLDLADDGNQPVNERRKALLLKLEAFRIRYGLVYPATKSKSGSP